MIFKLYNRDFSNIQFKPELNFEVTNYHKNVTGGCKDATVTATGDENELWALINHLRAPVEILSDGGDRKWWGYIKKVSVAYGIGYSVDIETMANRVAVCYTIDNVRYTTPWAEDADTITAYGIKEKLLAQSDTSYAAAIAIRDTALSVLKTPANPPNFSNSGGATATIECAGWLGTLDWRYYANATGVEAFDIEGNGGREIGEDDRPILAQSFQITATTAWTASVIHLQAWKQGSAVETGMPSDNLVVSLKADNAGVPGATLATAQIAAANLGNQKAWYEFQLSVPVTLNPGTTYWIHVARSGAVNATAFYMVAVSTNGGYANGQIKLWNTGSSSWTNELAGWDMVFRVLGNSLIMDQIAPLVTACGQFITGVELNATSEITSNPYRDGDTTGLFELLKLLAGGSVNGRRLLPDITPERRLRINEEAAAPANNLSIYVIGKEKQLMTNARTLVPPDECLVGIWCRLVDLIPPTVDYQLVSDPSLFFVEEAEYIVAEDRYNITLTRNQKNAFDIGGVTQG